MHNQAQNNRYLQMCLLACLSAYAHVYMFTCPFKQGTSYMLIMQNSLYCQAILSLRLLRYTQHVCRDLWHTHFVWHSCTAIQVKCTPVSVHLNSRTWRQPGLSVYVRTSSQPGNQIIIFSSMQFAVPDPDAETKTTRENEDE